MLRIHVTNNTYKTCMHSYTSARDFTCLWELRVHIIRKSSWTDQHRSTLGSHACVYGKKNAHAGYHASRPDRLDLGNRRTHRHSLTCVWMRLCVCMSVYSVNICNNLMVKMKTRTRAYLTGGNGYDRRTPRYLSHTTVAQSPHTRIAMVTAIFKFKSSTPSLENIPQSQHTYIRYLF